MNIYEIYLNLEDGETTIYVTAEDEHRAEDEAVATFFGLVRDVYYVELVGAA